MQKIVFHSADASFNLLHKKRLKAFIALLFEKERTTLYTLNYIFCSDKYLLDINQKFLQHDFFTDIITFDLSEAPNYIVGEIYISIDRVKENALLMKTNREEELLRVIFHGALHLCGFKDKKQSDIKIMREKEDQYLKLYKKFLFQ
jgi:rRNA maturation RNase YbeY